MHRPAQRNLDTTFPETPKRVQNTNPTSRNTTRKRKYAHLDWCSLHGRGTASCIELSKQADASQSKQRPSQSRPVPVCMRIRTYTPRNTKSRAKEAFNEACLRVLASSCLHRLHVQESYGGVAPVRGSGFPRLRLVEEAAEQRRRGGESPRDLDLLWIATSCSQSRPLT